MSQLAAYLLRYLDLAVENAPPAASSSSHFRMIAGVVIEFCAVTKRLDLLYGPVFSAFLDAGQAHTFVDLLEPFVGEERRGAKGEAGCEERTEYLRGMAQPHEQR